MERRGGKEGRVAEQMFSVLFDNDQWLNVIGFCFKKFTSVSQFYLHLHHSCIIINTSKINRITVKQGKDDSIMLLNSHRSSDIMTPSDNNPPIVALFTEKLTFCVTPLSHPPLLHFTHTSNAFKPLSLCC